MSKKLSMFDIAKLSGVSIATVSRVINKNGGYSKETEEHVNKVIEETGFVPNSNAKSLRTQISNTIGVIVPDLTNEFFSKLVREIELVLLPQNYSVIICDTNEDKDIEQQYLNNLVSRKVDGIIYISGQSDVSSVETIHSIPLVYIDRSPKNAKVLVHSDNFHGGYIAARTLIDAGARNLIMIRDIRLLSPVAERTNGFLKAISEYRKSRITMSIIDTEVSYEATVKTISNLFSEGIEFDGVFASNDTIALGVLHTVENNGKKVPNEVKIIGFDGISVTEYSRPTISTIKQDLVQIAHISCDQLLFMINGGKVESREFVVPVQLLQRDTTKST